MSIQRCKILLRGKWVFTGFEISVNSRNYKRKCPTAEETHKQCKFAAGAVLMGLYDNWKPLINASFNISIFWNSLGICWEPWNGYESFQGCIRHFPAKSAWKRMERRHKNMHLSMEKLAKTVRKPKYATKQAVRLTPNPFWQVITIRSNLTHLSMS